MSVSPYVSEFVCNRPGSAMYGQHDGVRVDAGFYSKLFPLDLL